MRVASALLVLLVVASAAATGGHAGTSAGSGLHVVGARLVDSRGRTLILRGVNRSGAEYACIQGWGIFDGPADAASVRAIASWN